MQLSPEELALAAKALRQYSEFLRTAYDGLEREADKSFDLSKKITNEL